jgi:glycosyltransferase involved in cell wall biosynthesis
MKILLINTSDQSGGAAVACIRLFNSLRQNGIHARLLLQEQTNINSDILSTTHSRMKHFLNVFRFVWERFIFSRKESSRDVRFAFSPATTGEDISERPEIRDADILHLHWINRGFLSLLSIEKLFRLEKPIVWTLHDMWLFTGGCHYAGDCVHYEKECHHCPFLKNPSAHDLSNKVFQAKLNLFQSANKEKITFVTCSHWLAKLARKSRLLSGFNIVSIPNTIDEGVFYPQEQSACRLLFGLPPEKKLLLFGAGNIFDKRKGLRFLKDALQIIKEHHPEWSSRIELVLFGKSKQTADGMFPFPVHDLDILTNEHRIASLYSACDLFVLPSLEDNLPNTVMESLACGTPVVAFQTGGIPEMIEHLYNGFLAEYRSIESMAEGIIALLSSSRLPELKQNARAKVERDYSQKVVANQYRSVYSNLLHVAE